MARFFRICTLCFLASIVFLVNSSCFAKKAIPITIASTTGAHSSAEMKSTTYSVGSPQVGALLNPVPLLAGKAFSIRPDRNFGTPELVDVLEAAGNDVLSRFPKSPRLYVGDLSYAHGGPIGRHVSHQSGRDADVSYSQKRP